MKRICFFMETPFNLGGEQRVVTTVANYLYGLGYEISFALTDKHQQKDYNMYNLNKNIKINYIENYNSFSNKTLRKLYYYLSKINYKTGIFKNNLSILKKFYCNNKDKKVLEDFFQNNKYDIIIGVASKYYSILSVLIDTLQPTRIIAWQHSCFEAYFQTKGRRFYNQDSFVKFMFNSVNTYITLTKYDSDKIKEVYNKDCVIINNPNSFKNDKVSELNNKVFLAVGRLEFVKGFDYLIESFYEFSQKNSEWNLYIVGDGPDREKYQDMINKLRIENRVKLVGATDNIENYYLNSSIFLFTSLWEGWGMALTEAMGYGLPIITYDLPSAREIFGTAECGYIVKQKDVTEFSNCMLELAQNNVKIKEIANNNINQVKKFDIEIIGKRWEEILENGK